MKRRIISLTVVGLIAVGIWLGGKFKLGFLGDGPGGGGENTPAPLTQQKDEPLIKDGVLHVRIEGQTIFAGGKESSVDQITKLAVDNDVKVAIARGNDARRRAREELEQALRDRNIHVVVE